MTPDWYFVEVAEELLEKQDLTEILADNDLTEADALGILMEAGYVKVPEWAEKDFTEEEE